jgi:hypothetical protein
MGKILDHHNSCVHNSVSCILWREVILEIFSIKLWRREARRLLDEMVNPTSVYSKLMKGYTMKEKIICYHIDTEDYSIPSKCGELHDPRTKWLWGHMLTNKATRDDSKFAQLFCPEGRRANWITHAMFKKMASIMVHKYSWLLPNTDLEGIVAGVQMLSKYQAHRLFKALIKHPAFCVDDKYNNQSRHCHDQRYWVWLRD